MEKIIQGIYICNSCKCNKTITTKVIIEGDDIDIFYNRTFDEAIKCCKCGHTMEKLDNEIFYAIKVLNNKGYKTRFSCAGHSLQQPAYITFLDVELMKKTIDKYGVPDRWYSENLMLVHGNTITLRSTINEFWFLIHRNVKINGKVLTYEKLHQKEINCLNKWVDKLPNIGEV